MEFPPIYSFPPFFTLQPTPDTKEKQLQSWSDVVRNYCKTHKISQININTQSETDLFENKKINRKCSLELIIAILKELEKRGYASTKNDKDFTVSWLTMEEWANSIYKYVEDSAQLDTIMTVYELHSGDYTTDQDFHGMDMEVMYASLELLEKQGRCEVFLDEAKENSGVKFYGTV